MRKNFSTKKGFTLVEMLVVLAIVALLSTMAVNSYLQYRKAALIDLNADELISRINELRNRAIFKDESSARIDQIKSELSGEDQVEVVVVDVSAKCYGVYFKHDVESYAIYSFKQDFDNQKQFDIAKGWGYKGCGEFDPGSPDIDLKEIVLDEQVDLLRINDSSGLQVDNLVLRFNPPRGSWEISTNLNDFSNNFADPDSVKFFDFTLQYGQVVAPRFSRTASLDLINFNFNKKNEENN